jgi:hypothetical protein
MIQIILNDDQAGVVQRALNPVELRNGQGRLIGYVSPPPSSAIVAEAKRRANSVGPWHTTQQVLDHLTSLEQG